MLTYSLLLVELIMLAEDLILVEVFRRFLVEGDIAPLTFGLAGCELIGIFFPQVVKFH